MELKTLKYTLLLHKKYMSNNIFNQNFNCDTTNLWIILLNYRINQIYRWSILILIKYINK